MGAPLRIGFWNTRLVPTSSSVPTAERIEKAAQLLGGVVGPGISFLGLCEVNTAVLCELKSRVPGLASYQHQAFDLPQRGASARAAVSAAQRWKLGFLFDPEVFDRVEWELVDAQFNRRTARVAVHVRTVVRSAAQALTIFLVHWPSQRQSDNAEIRKLCGIQLWNEVHRILHRDPDAWIVLAGDFNDDPFAESVSTCLRSTRDPMKAESRGILYNPSWRLLSGSLSDLPDGAFGTAFYSGEFTRWKTFDQILVSPGVVRRESGLSLIELERFDEAFHQHNLRGRTKRFDHIPIAAMFAVRRAT